MAKRNYIKRNTAYWTNKAIVGKEQIKIARSALGTKKDLSEYGKYKAKYFKISKYLRKGKVKVTSTARAELMTEEEFKDYQLKSGESAKEIASESYSMLNYKEGAVLQNKLADEGYKITIEQARAKQLSPEMWDTIDQYYKELKAQGLDYKSASLKVGTNYFGS